MNKSKPDNWKRKGRTMAEDEKTFKFENSGHQGVVESFS